MENRFQGSVNKIITEQSGRRYVQVRHNDQIFRVDFAVRESELAEAKALDDQYFTGNQQLTPQELRMLPTCGHVLYIRDPETQHMAGVCQLLFQSIPRQEVRMREAFSFGTVGHGYGQVLYKAQEVVARAEQKKLIRSNVRVENTEGIRSQLKSGYRIKEYDATRYGLIEEGGARLVMVKDLINEQLPFRPEHLARKVRDGDIPLVQTVAAARDILAQKPFRIGTYVWNENRIALTSHLLIEQLMLAGYTGIALLQPHELGESPGPRKLLVFHLRDAPVDIDKLSMPVQVHNEYGRLREVIVSFTPENAQIREEYAINDVARRNVNNIDPIAFKDEYNLFVGTLIDQGVRVVHTNAIGKDGKSAIFTRDPAMSIGSHFVIGDLRQQQREYELEGMREIAAEWGYEDLNNGQKAHVEGGDVIFIGPKKLVVGLGQRTNAAGFEKLRHAFPDYEFVGVSHTDLHLDVLFTVVGHKKCLADVTRLPEVFLEILRQDGYTIIPAAPAEQVSLGCNVVCIDDHKVIAVRENGETVRRLEENGVEVVEVSMPNVIKWGGGPRCMTCPTYRDVRA